VVRSWELNREKISFPNLKQYSDENAAQIMWGRILSDLGALLPFELRGSKRKKDQR
jgi:hypothetical protein